MNILLIIILILVVLLGIELFKHKITKNLFKYFIILIIVIITLLILSAYIDLGTFFGSGSTFAKTGAVIADGISESSDSIKETGFFEKVSDKTSELVNNIIDN